MNKCHPKKLCVCLIEIKQPLQCFPNYIFWKKMSFDYRDVFVFFIIKQRLICNVFPSKFKFFHTSQNFQKKNIGRLSK